MRKIRISIEYEVEKQDMPKPRSSLLSIFFLPIQCAKIAILHARGVVSDIMYATVMRLIWL